MAQSGKSNGLEPVKAGTPQHSPFIHVVFLLLYPLTFLPISLSHLFFPGTLLNYLYIFVTP